MRLHASDPDLQLSYLIHLTQAGLKPLSRWEGALDERTEAAIRAQGLSFSPVVRRARIGRRVREAVFARNPARVAFYRKRFEGTSIRHDPATVRIEGALFGYPSCCVESFIARPYAPNGLRRADQEILFHWACPRCAATPVLLRDYRRIHRACSSESRRSGGVAVGSRATRRSALAAAAATLAVALGSAGAARGDDPHWLPVADDSDGDYLTIAEEILRGTSWESPDTDGDLILDGVETARLIHFLITCPPPGIVVTEHLAYGLETCAVCGLQVNMGFVRVENAARGIAAEVPIVALHYLEHGGLSYDGSVHQGRVDLDPLKRILFAWDPPHQIPIGGGDGDGDGLLSEEEPPLGSDPGDPDSDDDSVPDGPQFVEGLLPMIGALPREVVPDRPYMLEWWANGVEQCEICSVTQNMGHAEIVNPLEGISVEVPFVALHFLAHGGLICDGTTNDGRILPTALRTVLTGDGTAHWVDPAGDRDQDGLTDEEEPYFGLSPDEPDENGDGVPDGRALARQFAERIESLPEGPLPDRVYKIPNQTLGFYACLVCGQDVNMGFDELVDPTTGRSAMVPYYNQHFMRHGSFSTDRGIYPRVDPREIAAVLGIPAADAAAGAEELRFALRAVPNPFTSREGTSIHLVLPAAADPICVTIHDAAGRAVREVYEGAGRKGLQTIEWNGCGDSGTPLPAGVYLCRVTMGDLTVTRKIALRR